MEKTINIGIISSRDITERKKYEEKIKYLSYHDKLTKLYNRAFFEDELERLNREQEGPLSIIIGDVNGLKLTNDIYGHSEGDKLLVEVAHVIRSLCRKEDIVARWGGDEFAIILPEISEKEASDLCKKINKSCKALGSYPVQISISLGSATRYGATRDIQEIIREAENNMYRHKLLESKSARSHILSSLQKSLFERSNETEEHANRLQDIGIKLGKALNLSIKDLDKLKLLTILHDIGKIAVPDSVLNKPGKLNDQEWEEIKKHPAIGYRIASSSSELSHIAEDILYHHERWDGSGYPEGLIGEAIPLLSRIISIVDAYDVMTHERVYKRAISHDEAIKEVKRCSGSQFDPQIVDKFVEMMMGENKRQLVV